MKIKYQSLKKNKGNSKVVEFSVNDNSDKSPYNWIQLDHLKCQLLKN